MAKDIALQIVVKAVNDTAGPDGIVPTLLVFEAFSRIVELDTPALSIFQRTAAVKKAINKIRIIHARRQIQDTLN